MNVCMYYASALFVSSRASPFHWGSSRFVSFPTFKVVCMQVHGVPAFFVVVIAAYAFFILTPIRSHSASPPTQVPPPSSGHGFFTIFTRSLACLLAPSPNHIPPDTRTRSLYSPPHFPYTSRSRGLTQHLTAIYPPLVSCFRARFPFSDPTRSHGPLITSPPLFYLYTTLGPPPPGHIPGCRQ